MSNFDEIIDKAKDLAGTACDKAQDIALITKKNIGLKKA